MTECGICGKRESKLIAIVEGVMLTVCNDCAHYGKVLKIKELEEQGIGRPSTYAPILGTIQERRYVEKLDRKFQPTPLGEAVCGFLVKNFAEEMQKAKLKLEKKY